MIRDTSLKAWLNEVSSTLGARQIAVLEVFERDAGKDYTNAELARALEWQINRVTGRMFELRALGILEESQRRKCGVTGRAVYAWRVKDQPAIKPKAVSHLPNIYQMPSISEPGKTHKIEVTSRGPLCGCKGFLFRGTCSHIDKITKQAPRPEEMMNSLGL